MKLVKLTVSEYFILYLMSIWARDVILKVHKPLLNITLSGVVSYVCVYVGEEAAFGQMEAVTYSPGQKTHILHTQARTKRTHPHTTLVTELIYT